MNPVEHDFNLILSEANIGERSSISGHCRYAYQFAELNDRLLPYGLRAYKPAMVTAFGCSDVFFKRI